MKSKIAMSASYCSERYSVFDYDTGKYTVVPSFEQLIESIKWASEVGFTGIEMEAMNETQLREVYTRERIRKFKETSDERGITITSFEPYFLGPSLTSLNRDTRKEALDILSNATEVGGDLGVEAIMLPSSPLPGAKIEWSKLYGGGPPEKVYLPDDFSWKRAWENYVSTVGQCADLVHDAELLLSVEPRTCEIVSNSDGALRLIRDVGSPNLRIAFDTAHFFAQKEILPAAIDKLGEKIFSVHMSDNDGSMCFHWRPGKGKIDWVALLKRLTRENYKGFLIVEISGLENGEDLQKEYVRGKEYLEATMREL